MTVAFLSSQRSKDPNKQVGAVIASESKLILGRFFLILSFVRRCLRRLARLSLSLREVALTFFCDYIKYKVFSVSPLMLVPFRLVPQIFI